MAKDWVDKLAERVEERRSRQLIEDAKAQRASARGPQYCLDLCKHLGEDIKRFNDLLGYKLRLAAAGASGGFVIENDSFPFVRLQGIVNGSLLTISGNYKKNRDHSGNFETKKVVLIAGDKQNEFYWECGGTHYMEDEDLSEMLLSPVFEVLSQ